MIALNVGHLHFVGQPLEHARLHHGDIAIPSAQLLLLFGIDQSNGGGVVKNDVVTDVRGIPDGAGAGGAHAESLLRIEGAVFFVADQDRQAIKGADGFLQLICGTQQLIQTIRIETQRLKIWYLAAVVRIHSRFRQGRGLNVQVSVFVCTARGILSDHVFLIVLNY
ncbi:hypothetical protein D3C84_614860 [compost metagenome]